MRSRNLSPTFWFLAASVVVLLASACAHRSASGAIDYWDSMVVLTEAFEADPDATIATKDLGFSKDTAASIDKSGDGRIDREELWAHQEESAARGYRGPRDLSEMSGHREGGFPMNVEPEIVAADEVDLGDEDLVMGIVIDGEARAYPVNYMNGPLNEVVNDTLAGEPIASTW